MFAEFKEIRKEWKARKKEEENQRKAAEERERAAAAAAAAQASQVDTTAAAAAAAAADPAPTPSYQTAGVRPQLPPIGYQPDGQVAGQYVYPSSNGQIPAYPAAVSYPHSPYGQGSTVYQQSRE